MSIAVVRLRFGGLRKGGGNPVRNAVQAPPGRPAGIGFFPSPGVMPQAALPPRGPIVPAAPQRVDDLPGHGAAPAGRQNAAP